MPAPACRFPSVRCHRLLALGAIVLLLAAVAGAEPLTSIPNPRTRDGTWVTDMPRMLRADTTARLNATIGQFERTNGAEVAVVVIRSLDGMSIDQAAVRLFERWGIGKKHTDNGLLLLWSTGDRRIRVEVGYGLEGVLPDGKVGAILDAYVMPKFRAGRFDEGLIAGVDALLSAARNEPVSLPSPRSVSYENRAARVIVLMIGLLAGIPIIAVSLVGFRKWRRYRRPRCPACRMRMTRVGEAEDDALLDPGQQIEERVKSVDYDVWQCEGCGHHFSLRYPKLVSRYAKCPQCHNHTKSSSRKVIVQPTTTEDGSELVTETCAFCSFRSEHTKALPRIDQSASAPGGPSYGSSVSGGSPSGGWSGGDGSFGGGGSSSFGGGESGGGGASRGY